MAPSGLSPCVTSKMEDKMNGRVAKKIRKKVYGDKSLKEKRRYSIISGTRFCMGERAEYQDAKKDYKGV